MKRSILVATVAMVGAVFGAAPAMADQTPAGCTKSGLVLNIERSQTLVRNGDSMEYYVSIGNDAPGSCNVTNAVVQLYLPTATGEPSSTPTIVASGASYPAGFREVRIGTVPYAVTLNPGVTSATVRATVDGILHDVPDRVNPASVQKQLGTYVPPPTMALTKVANPLSGVAPLTVTYTYTLTNTSPLDLPIKDVVVSDDLCSPVAYTGGDADGDALLDLGELWTFACTTTHVSPGTYTNTAVASGKGSRDNTPVTAGPVKQTVTVTSPPVVVSSAPPKVTTFAIPSVNSASAKPEAKCIATPKTLSVRAKELTTVRVTVSGADVKGATVKITGPGFVKTAKTSAAGLATFKVRATKSGTIVIQSDRCLGADRVSVKAARKTQSRQVPRVTG